MDREEYYTLSFFDKPYKKALAYLGTHSGRNEDKIRQTNLTPVFYENTTYLQEAKLVLVCRKLYSAPLVENGFFDKTLIEDNYPQKDFHTMYIGEIVKVFVNSEQE